MTYTVCVTLTEDDWQLLAQICGDGWNTVATNVPDLVQYLVRAAADGVRRPGSWERGWIQQATGPLM